MKTIRNYFLLFALTIVANITMAAGTGDINVEIRPLEEEKAVVAITNNSGSDYSISVKNEFGEDVLRDKADASESNYRKIYNFSQLANGNYRMVVTIGETLCERDFSISNGTIDVGELVINEAPHFSVNDDVLRLAYINKTGKDAKLSIYQDGKNIYKKELGKDASVNEALSLAQLESGSYRALLSVNSTTYNYDLEIK